MDFFECYRIIKVHQKTSLPLITLTRSCTMYCLFSFNSEQMCFVHVLLNALDLDAKGKTVKIVIEGSSVKLVPQLEQETNPFHAMYLEAREKNLIAGVCKACSSKMGVLSEVKDSGLPLLDDMSGHPSMESFIQQGYTIITF